MQKPVNMNPKRVWMDENDCERMNRAEFEAMRCLLGAVNYAVISSKDLQKRLECIPSGKQRMNMAIGAIRAIADDIVGTMTLGQCRQLKNTMQDMEIRMVPKMTRMSQNVVLEKENARGLFNIAMEKCRGCVEDSQSCRECALYKVLEGTLPLDSYNSLSCPYAISEWKD